MRMLATLLLTAGLALAQLDTDTITIVARSPATSVPPGSISVSLSVRPADGTSLDDVLAVVSGVGLTERDLIGVDAPTVNACFQFGTTCTPTPSWRFQFTAPLASLKDTLGKLGRIGGGKSGISVSYSVNSTDTSTAPDCAYPTLVSQARRYAENVATAAGVRVGRVVALADSPLVGSNAIPTLAYRSGDFSQLYTGVFLAAVQPTPIFQTSCGVAVQFQLLR
jgi:hypothetical protein